MQVVINNAYLPIKGKIEMFFSEIARPYSSLFHMKLDFILFFDNVNFNRTE